MYDNIEKLPQFFIGNEQNRFHNHATFPKALFQNRQFVTVEDVYNAIKTSKRIYPDSIVRELAAFKLKFKDVLASEGVILPDVKVEEISSPEGMI